MVGSWERLEEIGRGGGPFDKALKMFDAFDDVQNFNFGHLPHCHCFLCSKKNPMDGSGFVADFLTLDFSRFFSSSMRCLLFSCEVGKKIPALRIFPPFHPSPVTSEGVEGKYLPFRFLRHFF